MSAYAHTTSNVVVTRRRCKLLSVTLSQESSGTGTVRVYDEVSAQSSQLVLELYQDGDGSVQFRFEGLELENGMYIEVYSRVDHVTVEWEPVSERVA